MSAGVASNPAIKFTNVACLVASCSWECMGSKVVMGGDWYLVECHALSVWIGIVGWVRVILLHGRSHSLFCLQCWFVSSGYVKCSLCSGGQVTHLCQRVGMVVDGVIGWGWVPAGWYHERGIWQWQSRQSWWLFAFSGYEVHCATSWSSFFASQVVHSRSQISKMIMEYCQDSSFEGALPIYDGAADMMMFSPMNVWIPAIIVIIVIICCNSACTSHLDLWRS